MSKVLQYFYHNCQNFHEWPANQQQHLETGITKTGQGSSQGTPTAGENIAGNIEA